MKRSSTWKPLLVLLALALVAGCAGQAPAPAVGSQPKDSGTPAAAPAPAPGAPGEIKVGVLIPLTGPLSAIGQNLKYAHDMAAQEINDAGGIKSMGGAKIKLIYADTQGDPKVGMSETERLVVSEKVVALLGAFQSSVSYPSTEVAERYKIPYIVPNSVMDAITERGFKYTFRLEHKASLWAKDQIDFLVDMSKRTGTQVKNVAFVFENTDQGQSTAKGWRQYAQEAGLKVLLDESYTSKSSDLTPVALKVKGLNPDAVLMVSYISDAILLQKAYAEQKVNAKAFIGSSSGHSDPSFVKEVGALAEHLFDLTEWNADLKHSPLVAEKNNAFKKFTPDGRSFNGGAAFCYAGTWILADALERAKAADPQKIRDALAATRITTGPATIIPWSPIEFDDQGQAKHTRMIMVQYQKGVRTTVWPADVAAAQPVWPAPTWESRK